MYNEKKFYYLCIVLIVGHVKRCVNISEAKLKVSASPAKTFYPCFIVVAREYA